MAARCNTTRDGSFPATRAMERMENVFRKQTYLTALSCATPADVRAAVRKVCEEERP